MDPRGAGGVGRNRPDQKERDRDQAGRNARDNARAARATALGAISTPGQKPTITRTKKNVDNLFGGPDDTVHETKARGAVKVDPNVGPGTPGSIPNYPLADPLYGPTRLLENIGSPLAPVRAPLQEAGVLPSATDALGLERGPQVGWSKGNRKEETKAPGGSDSLAAAEERRKRRLAAQQTALGSNLDSLLGPGVLPI